MSDFSKVIFQINIDKMLKDKPDRFKSIIQSKIDRHNEYLARVNVDLELNDLNIVAQYIVQLDSEYVSIREDNE